MYVKSSHDYRKLLFLTTKIHQRLPNHILRYTRLILPYALMDPLLKEQGMEALQ